MRRIIALSSLMALALALGAPSSTEAQTAAQTAAQTETMAPPVPGPYQAAPKSPGANPYGNAAPLPYWMRPRQGQTATARGGNAAPQSFIPGWIWTPYAPGRGSAMPDRPRATGQNGQYGQGYWPGSPQPGYATRPWSPPGYARGGWPNPQFRAPQYYGATPQPNQ